MSVFFGIRDLILSILTSVVTNILMLVGTIAVYVVYTDSPTRKITTIVFWVLVAGLVIHFVKWIVSLVKLWQQKNRSKKSSLVKKESIVAEGKKEAISEIQNRFDKVISFLQMRRLREAQPITRNLFVKLMINNNEWSPLSENRNMIPMFDVDEYIFIRRPDSQTDFKLNDDLFRTFYIMILYFDSILALEAIFSDEQLNALFSIKDKISDDEKNSILNDYAKAYNLEYSDGAFK